MPGLPSNQEIGAQWRSLCMSPYAWKPDPNQAGVVTGEAGGYWVVSDGFPRRAYLKPANARADENTHARAAREKIASDLARDLRLPVPPALLAKRENPPAGCTANVVVTLIMYPAQWPWAHVRGYTIDATPLGAAMAGALARCSPLLAFDTWLAQTDHGDHPDNVIWGYDPQRLGESAILFLDYANSMGFNGSWVARGWANAQAAPWPPLMLTHLDVTLVQPVIAAIEAFPEEAIREVVYRVPDEYLAPDQKGIVVDGLIGRRPLVQEALRSILRV